MIVYTIRYNLFMKKDKEIEIIENLGAEKTLRLTTKLRLEDLLKYHG